MHRRTSTVTLRRSHNPDGPTAHTHLVHGNDAPETPLIINYDSTTTTPVLPHDIAGTRLLPRRTPLVLRFLTYCYHELIPRSIFDRVLLVFFLCAFVVLMHALLGLGLEEIELASAKRLQTAPISVRRSCPAQGIGIRFSRETS